MDPLRNKYRPARKLASLRYIYRRKSPYWLRSHIAELETRRRIAREVLFESLSRREV